MVNVIYFNQWFSSITTVIEDIKKKMGDSVKIIASSRNPEHAYKSVVDKFIVEDWEEGKDEDETHRNYIEFLLKVCEENKVDVFFVKKNAEDVASRAEDFGSLGVKLIVEDIHTLEKIKSKLGVYEYLIEKLPEGYKYIIPRYEHLESKDNAEMYLDISDLIDKIKNDSENWCLKLDVDEGGNSFRKIIRNETLNIDSLKNFRVNEITLTETYEMLKRLKIRDAQKLLFMELLDSPEISVDCYDSDYGFISICREKLPKSRVQRIFYSKEIAKICLEIKDIYGLKKPFNVQFRVKHGGNKDNIKDLRLLEINPRMSGGVYYGTLFDMNIAEIVLKDTLGCSSVEDYFKCVEFNDKKVTFIEQPIRLNTGLE